MKGIILNVDGIYYILRLVASKQTYRNTWMQN